MSSARQGLTIIGQAAGAALFGPIGAAIGGIVGGEIGGAIDGPPQGPRLDDTSAPTLEFGSKVPRLYGTTWCTLSPRWWSGLRESSQVVGGKGADSGVDTAVYHADLLGVLGEVDLARWPNPVITRIRIDGKVQSSRRATSSIGTLIQSLATEMWSDVELFTGAAAQAPWSVMEAAEGSTNANAYRGQLSIGFTNFLMQNGRRPSLIEVEIATKSTAGATAALTLLQSRFVAASASDESAYARGAPTQNGGTVIAGAFVVDRNHTLNPATPSVLTYTPASLVPNGTDPITFEMIGSFVTAPNISQLAARFRFVGSGVEYLFGWAGAGSSIPAGAPFFRASPAGAFVYGTPSAQTHFALLFTATDQRAYIDGVLVWVSAGNSILTTALLTDIGDLNGYTSGSTEYTIRGFRIRQEEVYTGVSFAPPTAIAPPDGALVTYTPAPVDLRDVLESEMLRCEPLTAAHIDMSAAAGKLVHGFKAAGSAAQACATLLDWYYLDLFCADKITCVLRGGAVEQTVPYGYTGAGQGDSSDPFAGLTRENDVERQRVTAVQYINLLADGEVDTQTGDRVGTGNETRQVNFSIYSKPTEAKGRADTITLDTRVAAHKASVRLGARHAARMQPASVVGLIDNKGNTYRVRVLRLVWNQGVYDVDCCLDDPNILSSVGIATEVDTSVIEVTAPAIAEWLALDLPKLRPADNEPGYMGLVKTPASSAGARWLDSADNVTYAARADYANDAVFGSVTAASGSFTPGPLFDEGSSLTVYVGDGVLTSATRAALLVNRELNAFAVGINGRLVLGQYRTATQLSAGVYTLTGFVNLGAKGTERYCASIVAGDRFARLGTQGTARIPRTLAQLGAAVYTKAVTIGRSETGVVGVPITPAGVSLKPLSTVHPRTLRNVTTGDIAITWTRRTRDDTRFGGPLGDACPLGEANERYRVRLYTSGTFATLLRDLGTLTSAAVTYTSAQRTADGHTPITAPLYLDVRQLSDVVGEGYPLQAAA